MARKRKSPVETVHQMKKLVDEIVDYVNSDLIQRNAERLLPGFSRDNLFVKPEGWDKFFHRQGTHVNGSKNGATSTSAAALHNLTREELLDQVITRSQKWLLAKQNSEAGFWCAPLLADATLECDTITLYAYMGWLETKKDKIRRMANFILSKQLSDGGWGERCESYDDPAVAGQGPSTPSQTAWALLALFAGGRASGPSVERGIRYLLATQRDDGSWEDGFWNGAGFPRVFFLKYHLYAKYFPLWALGVYRQTRG
jgi:squalene cyclase